MKRRLAAILAVDAVGYSRLMRTDEEGTLRRLKALRHDLIGPLIDEHAGRLFKLMGDGFLVEFSSINQAINCAIRWQKEVEDLAGASTEDTKMRFRMGLHIGDVLADGDDLYGDGVNIASRLEGLAEPGTICISEDVRRQLKEDLPERIIDLGPQTLKNIDDDFQVFQVSVGKSENKSDTELEASRQEKKPTILVLPFISQSTNAELDYLADGIGDEVTYALSRVGTLSVISRNAAFSLKGQAINIRRIAKELGVGYVLSGKLRVAMDRVRIMVELSSTSDGKEIWADRFEGKLEDVFELQDNITAKVVGALGPKIRMAEIGKARRRPPESLDAYTLFLRALPLVHSMTQPDYLEAQALLRHAFEIDDSYALAKALYAWCSTLQIPQGWGSVQDAVAEGVRVAKEALSAGQDDPEVLCYAGYSLGFLTRDESEGISVLKDSIFIDPNSAQSWVFLGWLQLYEGNLEDAERAFQRSLDLSPFDPFAYRTHAGLSFTSLFQGRYESAIAWGKRALRENPNFSVSHRALAAALANAGRQSEAQEVARSLCELVPSLTVKSYTVDTRFRVSAHRGLLFGGLEEAGVPAA